MIGQIVKIVSNTYTVYINNKFYDCNARGKFRNEKLSPVVGDYCEVDLENNYILKILNRNNELKRPVIANVDIALIVTSTKHPDLSLYLLDKLVCLATLSKVTPIICFTKIDLLDKEEKKNLKLLKNYYESIGIKVVYNREKFKIKHFLKNKLVVLTGQTGAGKSSLINYLDSTLNLKTDEISEALGRGKHTTRHVEIFEVGKMRIADTPGFSALDLNEYSKENIRGAFKEFSLNDCVYKDCFHLNEKECNVKKRVNSGKILKSRYENYQKIISEMR